MLQKRLDKNEAFYENEILEQYKWLLFMYNIEKTKNFDIVTDDNNKIHNPNCL